MIPVSFRFPVCLLAAVIGTAGFSLAGDIIKLKSGEKLDGVIVSETPTEVTIEIQTGRGGSIRDPRKVLRKDIVELVKATPDQFEAAELGKQREGRSGAVAAGVELSGEDLFIPKSQPVSSPSRQANRRLKPSF